MFSNLSKYIEGANLPVITAGGKVTKRVYFNNAATTLALRPIMQVVNNNIPLLTYIDAPGALGRRNTKWYEDIRDLTLNFVGGNAALDTVIYVKNSTEGINLLSDLYHQENPDQVIITTAMEHMANYLPYKNRFKTVLAGVTPGGELDLADLEKKLKKYKNKVKLVAVTGASNVTGITPPIYQIARLVHQYKAKILVDVVQLIQHQPFSMKPHDDPEHIDYIVFSAHKCYTPIDGGILIGPDNFFKKYLPFLDGAGTTEFISSKKIIYTPPPQRFEAGFPDLFGIIAMGEALKFLKNVGLHNIAAYEKKLYDYAKRVLKNIPGVTIYAENSTNVKIPCISFNIQGVNYRKVAKTLASQSGIEVGAGTVGANIYVQSLVGVSPEKAYQDYLCGNPAGLVRISLGMYNTLAEIDHFAAALSKLTKQKESRK